MNSRGFTLIELLLVIAVIGIMSAVTIPLFMSFLQSEQTRGAAREVTTLLNQARQLAITRNTSYRVEVDTGNNRLRFVRDSDSTAWTGPGTDSNGYITLSNQSRLTAAPANPIKFSPLGAATNIGTITVQNQQGTSTMNVVVSSAGRIRQCIPGPGCP